MTARIGCIADDYTGATDAASALRGAGVATSLRFGVPPRDDTETAPAVIVALKGRSIPADEAVAASLAAGEWLRAVGIEAVLFKVASTFDSTFEGNIGPVADALLDALRAPIQLVTPASPQHGRTVRDGRLWVGDSLLAESPMRHHPLNPMTESSLVALMERQSRYRVGLVPLGTVRAGVAAARARLDELAAAGTRHAIGDAVTDGDLDVLSAATADGPLATGAAGLAGAIGRRLAPVPNYPEQHVRVPDGPLIVLAGSLSVRTREQVAAAERVMPSYRLDAKADRTVAPLVAGAVGWLDTIGSVPACLVASDAIPDPAVAEVVERAMAEIAGAAVARGRNRVVVAGGETSGAVVDGLGIRSVLVARDAAPGVPWIVEPVRGLGLMLKSGNFGPPDLFVAAAAAGAAA